MPKASPRRSPKAIAGFKAMSSRQKAVGPDAVWVQFSASRPGVVPAGTDGSTKDLRVYENVVAVVESGGKHGQVQIGTLGSSGRRVAGDRPARRSPARGRPMRTPRGFFFQAAMAASQRDGRRRPQRARRKNCWPTWRISTARPPRQPRPISRPV